MNKRENPSRVVALDLMLRTFMTSADFTEMEPKNWDAIARLIPGVTPHECSQRFEELKASSRSKPFRGNVSSLAAHGRAATLESASTTWVTPQEKQGNSDSVKSELSKGTELTLSQESLRSTANTKEGAKDEAKLRSTSVRSLVRSPNMVIHVCDEAKNVKKDFSCPRDLLVEEMQYFAEYLSNDAQRWEEVDISVHCDVQIFDWLMKYVKRDLPEFKGNPVPCLEPGNVISILISSDFLKMDSLVEDCIKFCHDNMSAIISTPCNMNCINDKLCTRIASLFTEVEVDGIKDRKDKFKSKLFMKKIERFFEPGGPGHSMFRCQFCTRLLTKESTHKLNCTPGRLSIDKYGKPLYHHKRDSTWDPNDYVISLKKELKTWRDVFWRLWGHANYLPCVHCLQVFPCTEYSQCYVHPEKAKFIGPNLKSLPVGVHGCCNQQVLKFSPFFHATGCEVRDHVIDSSKDTLGQETSGVREIFNILQDHKEAISVPPSSSNWNRWSALNFFSGDEALSGVTSEGLVIKSSLQQIYPDDLSQPSVKEFERGREVSTEEWDSSDDEVGDDEPIKAGAKSKVTRRLKKKASGKSVKSSVSSLYSSSTISKSSQNRNKWDSHRSLRSNQDAQREDDRSRNEILISHLVKQRQESESSGADARAKQKEYVGGIYSKLDCQFKASVAISKPCSLPTQSRTKARLGQVRAT